MTTKIIVFLFCILLLLNGCIGEDNRNADEEIPGAGIEDYHVSVDEEDYRMWLEWDTPFADADKSGNGDSQLCWAAAVANILTWTGWAEDENDTFDTFRGHFADEPGYLYDALRYYFNEFVSEISADMVTVREVRPTMLDEFLVSALYDGKGVVIKIKYPNRKVGHFLTIYGYRLYPEQGRVVLFYTDSEDRRRKIREMFITWDEAASRWEIGGLYGGWFLEYAVSLDRR